MHQALSPRTTSMVDNFLLTLDFFYFLGSFWFLVKFSIWPILWGHIALQLIIHLFWRNPADQEECGLWNWLNIEGKISTWISLFSFYSWPHISCQVMEKVFLSLLLLLLAVLVDLLLFLAPHIVSGHASVAEKKSVALFLQFVRSALATWLKPKIRDIWALHILTTFDDQLKIRRCVQVSVLQFWEKF